MKRVLLTILLAAGLLAANPVLVTFLSEFSADTLNGQWFELHPLPVGWSGPWDLSGWQVITSTSACTLRCTLDYYQPFIVIDSADLSAGINGTGMFRLNLDSDFIRLIDTNGWIQQTVSYPYDSTGADRSLRPPPGSSASFWNADFLYDQVFNWYLDSTPTPGVFNNGSSTISGTVLLDSMPSGADVHVVPHGRHAGSCLSYDYMNAGYSIQGLGAGWYRVEAWVHWPHGTLGGFYPDSVYVGFNEIHLNINIDLRTVGVAEPARPVGTVVPELRERGAELDVFCPTPTDARLAVYDLTGACRAILHEGLLEHGVHRFDLASRVRAGVYFAQLLTGRDLTTRKVVVMH